MTKYTFLKTITGAAIIGLLVLLGVATQATAQGRRIEALQRAMQVQDQHADALMATPGVVGTATGLSYDGRSAVKVFLTRPGIAGIPDNLQGIPVVTRVVGEIIAMSSPTDRFDRPVPIGVSTGHADITAGTIGCRVTDGTDVFALSNNHVYADENQASLGDAVLQPGALDGGTSPDDDIGILSDFEPIDFCQNFFNRFYNCSGVANAIDAAIALSSTVDLGNGTMDGGYGVPNSSIWNDANGDGAFDDINSLLGINVQKCGRTTGCTQGIVTAINATVDVGYGTGLARFVNQIIVEPNNGGPFIQGGDSGSLLVTLNPHPVGLLFAGTSDGSIAIANRIDLVLNRFGVTVDGDQAPPSPDTIGPVTSLVDANPNPTEGASPVSLTATVDDSVTGGSIVTASEYFTGAVGPEGSGIPMSASNGGFNSVTEDVTADIDVSGYSPGDSITLSVRGRDDQSNWGAVSSIVLNVTAAPPPPPDTIGPMASLVDVNPNPTAGAPLVTLTAAVDDSATGGSIVTASEYFIGAVGPEGSGIPMSASDGDFNSVTEDVTADIDVSGYSPGDTITLSVRGQDDQSNWGAVSSIALNVTAAPPPDPVEVASEDFESGGWSGGIGWSGPWAHSGDARIRSDNGPYSGFYHLRLRRSSGLAERSVDLSGYTGPVYLSFCAKVNSFERSDEAVVKVNGTVVKTFTASDSDDTYRCYGTGGEFSLPVGGIVTIAVDAEMSSRGDRLYIDEMVVVEGAP